MLQVDQEQEEGGVVMGRRVGVAVSRVTRKRGRRGERCRVTG